MDSFKQLMEHILRLKESKFTGYVKINFSQGGIAKVEQHEEILKRKSLRQSSQ